MNTFLSGILLLSLCANFLAGLGGDDTQDVILSDANKPDPTVENKIDRPETEFPLELTYASGVGAWGSTVKLNQDGSFTGFYHDSDMGDSGEGYKSTMYVCEFQGKFTDIWKLNDYSYSLTLDTMSLTYEAGKTWIEDQIRYVAEAPLGMEAGKAFVFYLPETPLDGLDEEFLGWWPGRFLMDTPDAGDTLGDYGLWNQTTGAGFFAGIY